MNYILFDGKYRKSLLPFTYTRPIADIRVGILTIREKWEYFLQDSISTLTQDYLSKKYYTTEAKDNILINSSFLPNQELVNLVTNLEENQAVVQNENVIAFRTGDVKKKFRIEDYNLINFENSCVTIKNTWDIFINNDFAIKSDFLLVTKGRESQPIPKTVNVINPENIFIEKGAKLEFVTLNASKGVMYLGKDSKIMEGSVIKGSFALCEGAHVKLATKIYGATTVGPHCRVGGEISNSVLMGYSNKGHDGFLGNSVLGEWCNIGADSNNSNLKNNYNEVKLWNYDGEEMQKTGLQFCGLMMGDHSKCGINTMFNTGTVVGVFANIFGGGFVPKFVPSFSWGGSEGFKTYIREKALNTAKIVMNRRNIEPSQEDINILESIFEQTSKYRNF